MASKSIAFRIVELLIVTSDPLTAPQLARRLSVEVNAVYTAIKKLLAGREINSVPFLDGSTGYIWRGKATGVKTPPRRSSVTERPDYDGKELKPFSARPGCNQHEQYGSRMGNAIIYRDQSIEFIQ